MAKVIPGRFTAHTDEAFVVFIIGIRVNKFFAFLVETFLVEARKYEALYGNMPLFGLAASTTHVSASGPRETARRRLGGQNEPAIVSPVPPTESA